jgi:hypothetical protein
VTAPNTPTRAMEAELADLLERVKRLERGGTQLGNSSLDGTALRVVSPDGTTLSTWGVQPDGTAGTKNINGKPPARPNTPIVTSAVAGIVIEWNGELISAKLADFSHVTVHVSPVPGFIPSDGNKIGALYQSGKIVASPLDYVTHYVKLVAWNTSDKSSDPSFEQSAEPGKVVADEVLDGIIDELALAENAVTEAKLAAEAVTSTKIGDDAITTPKLVAGAVQAEKIAAGAVATEKLAADAVTADKIKALSITADELAANSVQATKIAAGVIDATKLAATLVLGNRIIAGDPTGVRVELSASGIIVVRDDGDTTFSVDSSTGDVTSMGEYYTSRFGERLAMNSGGLQSPTIRAYPNRGSRYADLRSYTRTLRGQDVANWEFRVPLAPGTPYEAGLVDFMVYDANFAPVGSSAMRYRPFDNGSGNVHPGWAADGQDCAIVFWNGTAWITNAGNTGRQPLVALDLTAQRNIASAGEVRAQGAVIGSGFFMHGGAFFDNNQLAMGTRPIYCGPVHATALHLPPSHRELKTDVVPLAEARGTSALDVVSAAPVSTWRYTDEAIEELGLDAETEGERIGPMAGDLPDDVKAPQEDGHERINIGHLTGYLWEAVRELRAEVARLTDRIEELERPGRAPRR